MRAITLQEVANEMRDAAASNPLNLTEMAKSIVSQQFPDHLARHATINGVTYRIQFSCDIMPGGDRILGHLSFLREDNKTPTEEEREAFRKTFFGDNSTIAKNSNLILAGLASLQKDEIILMPSVHSHVVQMGKIVDARSYS